MLFACVIADPLETLRDELKARNPGALVLSYLDDIYVCADPSHVAFVVERAQQLFGPLGLELRFGENKTQLWCPREATVVPGAAQVPRVTSLPCLGRCPTRRRQVSPAST